MEMNKKYKWRLPIMEKERGAITEEVVERVMRDKSVTEDIIPNFQHWARQAVREQ